MKHLVSTALNHIYVMLLQMIDHPNVVKLVEVLANHTKIFIVLELINGGDLFDKMRESPKGLTEAECRKYFRQILSAVQHCHEIGVCHRDLKPENILVDENNQLKISGKWSSLTFSRFRIVVVQSEQEPPKLAKHDVWYDIVHRARDSQK